MMKKEQAMMACVFTGILLSVFSGMQGYRVDASETEMAAPDSVEFEWISTPPGQRVIKVATETEIMVPFRVKTKGGVSRIKFSVPRKFIALGIRVRDSVVTVKSGIASSAVLFNVPRGMPLGRYDLVIMIIDPASNKEIGNGTIPFILLPRGVECMC